MKEINVKQVLQHAKEEKLKPKPKPVIVRVTSSVTVKPPAPVLTVDVKENNNTDLVASLEREYFSLKKERNILSSQIWKMVENGATQEQLAEHYARIESYRPNLQALYDKLDYVTVHGHLPEATEENKNEPTLYELKELKRSLINRRDKARREIKLAEAKNPNKVGEVHLKLAKLDAEYEEVSRKIQEIKA